MLGTFRNHRQVSVRATQPSEAHHLVPVVKVVPEQSPCSAEGRPVVAGLVVSRVRLMTSSEGLLETANQPGAVGKGLELVRREIGGVLCAQPPICLRPCLASN